jgi:hypothetical protein
MADNQPNTPPEPTPILGQSDPGTFAGGTLEVRYLTDFDGRPTAVSGIVRRVPLIEGE